MKMQTEEMLTALVQLHNVLQEAELPLDVPGAADQRTNRIEVVDQLEDYVIPRLMTIDAPLLTVVGGSTGRRQVDAGELAGRHAGSPSPACSGRRPARRCWCTTPTTPDWFGQDRILPDLERADRPTGDPAALQLVPAETVPAGLAILDAPDIDSVEERNRTLAAQLLAAADLWLFVTSAARYADQVPWGFLAGRRAQHRGGDRARPDPAGGRRDRRRPPGPDAGQPRPQGLAAVRRPRGHRSTPTGCCPATAVADIRGWLRVAGRRRRRPRGGRASRRSRARSATSRGARTSSPTASTSRSPRPARSARTPRRPTPTRSRRSTRPAPTGPCCAVRCWPAGRSSSAPASCCAPWSPGSAGSATGWSARSRASRRRSSGSRSPSRPASRRCCSSTPRPPPSAPRRPGARSPHGRTLLDAAGAGPRPGLARVPPRGRARGARVAAGRARHGPQRGRRQAHAPRGSSPSASTGSRSR